MKKILILFLVFTLILPVTVIAETENKTTEESESEVTEGTENGTTEESENDQTTTDSSLLANATSGLLMEASTGTIIYEKEKDLQVSVASMTKMVLQIIVLEKIESGELKWDKVITVSRNAADMGGSQIYLEADEQMTIRDLFKGVTMASANDASVALAEEIAGSEEAFVKLMNEKVKELGLKNTQFKNCTGLDADDHYSTAYDMGMIARELLRHDEILDFSSVYEDYLRVDTANKFWLVNTNKLVRFYEGADGLKTGFTDAAKYCLAATAKKNDIRFIAIVLGEDEGKVRNNEAMELLDYGFNNFKMEVLKKQGETVDEVKLDKATENSLTVVPSYDVGVLQNKSESDKEYTYEVKMNKINLPVKTGDTVGKILVKDADNTIQEVPLISKTSAKKLNLGSLYLKILKESFAGQIN